MFCQNGRMIVNTGLGNFGWNVINYLFRKRSLVLLPENVFDVYPIPLRIRRSGKFKFCFPW